MIWTCASGGCPLLYTLHPCCMLFCQQGRWISIYDLVGAIGIDRRSFPCRSLRPKSLVWSTDPSRNGRRTAATRVVWFHRPKFAPDGTQPARRRQGRPGHRFQHRQVCPLLMLLLLLLAHLANWYKQHPREPVCFFPVFLFIKGVPSEQDLIPDAEIGTRLECFNAGRPCPPLEYRIRSPPFDGQHSFQRSDSADQRSQAAITRFRRFGSHACQFYCLLHPGKPSYKE